MALWLVRCDRHGECETLALGEGVVGIGWEQAGDFSGARTMEDVRAQLEQSYPEAKATTVNNWVAQIDGFISRIKVGDLDALPLKTSPAVVFGRVTGE